MVNLGDLPAELQVMIFDEVVDARPDKDVLHSGKVPRELCLVDRSWNEAFTPRLYSHFTYDGSFVSIEAPWEFLRTIVARPDIALHVQQLSLVTATFVQPTAIHIVPEAFRRRLRANHASFRQAFDRVFSALGRDRYDSLLAQAESDLLVGIMTPVEALIMALCPNLTRLQLSTAEEDPYLRAVLECALGESPETPAVKAFQNLELLYLAPKPHPLDLTGSHTHSIEIGEDMPFYRFPKLTEIMLLVTDPEMGIPVPAFPSVLKSLTISYSTSPDGISPILQNLKPYLDWASTLTQLSLDFRGTTEAATAPLYRQELWSIISHLADKLEYLDLPGLGYEYLDPNLDDHQPQLSVCPPLRNFTKLRYLSVGASMLYGHNCPHHTPHKLSSHLAPNLESLGIYCYSPAFTNYHIKELEKELENIGLAAPRVPLRSIVFADDTFDITRPTPLDALQNVAERKGIRFSREAFERLFFVGGATPFGVATYALNWDDDKFREIFKVQEIIPRGMVVHGFHGEL